MRTRSIGRTRTLALTSGALLLLMAALLASQLTPVARAAHLVSNGDFATDLAGWSATGATWDTKDAGFSAFSGSALVDSPGTPSSISQCGGSIIPGATYDLTARVYIDQANPPGHSVEGEILFFLDPFCTTSFDPAEESAASVSVYGQWQTLSVSGMVPEGALAVGVAFQAVLAAPEQFAFHLDNVVLAARPLPPPTRTPTAEATETPPETATPTTVPTIAPTTTVEPTSSPTETTDSAPTPIAPATGSGALTDGSDPGAWPSILAMITLLLMLAGGVAMAVGRSRG